MSQARITTVGKSRKPYKCEKCKDELPVGSQYRWFVVGFRSSFTHIRCMKGPCTPRSSELESSTLADAYSAQETAIDEIVSMTLEAGESQQVVDVLSDYGSALRDVSSQYLNADEQFGGGGNTDMGEKATALDSAADEIENWSPDTEAEPCEDHSSEGELVEDCDDCNSNVDGWWSDVLASARDIIESTDFTS